jgi:hypothetical protein
MGQIVSGNAKPFHEAFEPRQSPRFAMKIARRVQTAELQNGLAARLVSIETTPLVLLRQQIDVGLELFVEILIQGSAAKYRE